MKLLLGNLAEPGRLTHPGACPQHVDRARFPPDRVVQAVQVASVGGVALYGRRVRADQLDGLVQRVLPSARDEDARSFVCEQLGAGQGQPGRSAGNYRYLAIELSHGRSLEVIGLGIARDVMYTDLFT